MGFAVVRTASSGGAFFALASVVDNRTGDPVAIPAAILRPSPSATVEESVDRVLMLLRTLAVGGGTLEDAVATPSRSARKG